MNVRRYGVIVKGRTPLLMHWDNIEWSDAMDSWKNNPANKKGSKAGDDRSPAFRWIGSVYNDGKTVGMAADNISRSLMEGGAMVPVPGAKSNKTFKSQTQSGMKIDEFCPALSVNGKKTIPWAPIDDLRNETSFPKHLEKVKSMGFRLHIKRARIGQQKHVRVRPMFEDWGVEFNLSVWDDQLTEEALKDIIQFSGMYKGLGDWRPGAKTPGSWGIFELKELVLL